MRQYRQMKSRYPDAILLFRLGDFFETFGDDAVAAAAACGITLTKRNNGAGGDMPLAGFPHHQLDTYLPKLVRAGYRVAVCEQVEDPKQAKGIVKRDVVEVVTPGVVMYDKLLETKRHNYVAALVAPSRGSTLCGFSFCDVSTGALSTGEIDVTQIHSVLESNQPAELIVSKDEREFWESLIHGLSSPPSLTKLEGWLFDGEFTMTAITRKFEHHSLKGFGVDRFDRGLVAAGVLLHYVGESQKGTLAQITRMQVYDVSDVMMLDSATRRNLEIHQSMHGDGKQGALVSILDMTCTPMGGRMLRTWLQAPLLRRERIEARLGIVRGFVRERRVLDDVRLALQGIGDIERILTKIVTERASARELSALRHGLSRIPAIREACGLAASDALRDLGHRCNDHADVVAMLNAALVDEPAVHVGTGGIFRDGYDAEVDSHTAAQRHGKQWVTEYQEHERTATGIPSLKIGQTGVFGYYIEVTNAHRGRVPDHFVRKQTLANAERYTTPRLQEIEQSVMHAERLLVEREQHLLATLRRAVGEHCGDLQRSTALLAGIDTLASFATVACERSYCEPQMHNGNDLEIVGARHPVIETVLTQGRSYVANDVLLDPDTAQLMIITGPNMSGKSSYLRQVGLITFLAHIGCFVPATSARVPLTDRIFTRVGAQDNILAGESTFLVEMQESANILNNATRRSLILLDEVGRGTATFDGISIAWAIAEYLHERIGAKTLFATHYHELTALAQTYPRVRNAQVEVREVGDTIVFTHRVVPGHSDHSFGIHVARMAGLPASVITTANGVLARLESGQHVVSAQAGDSPSESEQQHKQHVQGELSFGRDAMSASDIAASKLANEVRTALAAYDVNNMTPMQAMQALHHLKEVLHAG